MKEAQVAANKGVVVLGRSGAVAQTLRPVPWADLCVGVWFQLWRLVPPGRTVLPLLPQTPWQDVVPPQHHWQHPRHPHAITPKLTLLCSVLPLNGEEPNPFGSLQRGQVAAGLRVGFVWSVEPQVTAVVGLQTIAQPRDEVRGVRLEAFLLPRRWSPAVREHGDG